MIRQLIALLLALIPVAAAAGVRATYAVGHGRPIVVEIADNGDVNAQLGTHRRLMIKSNRAFIIEDRLTGPVVTRIEDLAAIADERSASPGEQDAALRTGLVQQGFAEVNGRRGRAYFFPRPGGAAPGEPVAVISDDPALADLASAMRRLFAAEDLRLQVEQRLPAHLIETQASMRQVLEDGAPLRFGDWGLRTVERQPIAPETFTLSAEPETREALRARLAAEAAEDERGGWRDRMISRAIFAGGRLWLLTDSGGLSSLAEGDRTRARQDLGEEVLDICVNAGAPVAVTGGRARGSGWAIRRWRDGRWEAERSVARAGDTLVAVVCGPGWEMLLTNRRLIDLSSAHSDPLRFSQELPRALVNAVVHVTPDAAFVGINAGEWGGGLKRIDRRSGRISTIERNATGGLCDGPLNSSCDPVNGVATIPWRRECVAVAVGLIHMTAHGRIVAVCPDGVEQLFAAADDIDPADRRAVEEAAAGRYGSVAFFGLAVIGDALVAVGHNGLHRIDASGAATHQPWPRFTNVDGVLVSFALPDLVLVLTELNRRASVSGSAPLLVVR